MPARSAARSRARGHAPAGDPRSPRSKVTSVAEALPDGLRKAAERARATRCPRLPHLSRTGDPRRRWSSTAPERELLPARAAARPPRRRPRRRRCAAGRASRAGNGCRRRARRSSSSARRSRRARTRRRLPSMSSAWPPRRPAPARAALWRIESDAPPTFLAVLRRPGAAPPGEAVEQALAALARAAARRARAPARAATGIRSATLPLGEPPVGALAALLRGRGPRRRGAELLSPFAARAALALRRSRRVDLIAERSSGRRR